MVKYTDSTPAAACNTDTFVGSFPEKTNSCSPDPFRGVCGDADGMTLDHVVRVLDAIEANGGSFDLNNLFMLLEDASSPVGVIMAMFELDLIEFDEEQPLSSNLAVHRLV